MRRAGPLFDIWRQILDEYMKGPAALPPGPKPPGPEPVITAPPVYMPDEDPPWREELDDKNLDYSVEIPYEDWISGDWARRQRQADEVLRQQREENLRRHRERVREQIREARRQESTANIWGPAVSNPYDPYTATQAPPSRGVGTRGAVRRASNPWPTASTPSLFEFVSGGLDPWAPRAPRARESSQPRTRSPPRTQPGNEYLTQLQQGGVGSTPSAPPRYQLGRITRTEQTSDPCAVRVREQKRRQRRRRKECTKFVYKRIKVCQSSNAKPV